MNNTPGSLDNSLKEECVNRVPIPNAIMLNKYSAVNMTTTIKKRSRPVQDGSSA